MTNNTLSRTENRYGIYAIEGLLMGDPVRISCSGDNTVMISLGAITSCFLSVEAAAELGRHLVALANTVEEKEATQ